MLVSDTQEIQGMCHKLKDVVYTHLARFYQYDENLRAEITSQIISGLDQVETRLISVAGDRADCRELLDQSRIESFRKDKIIAEQGRVIGALQEIVATVSHLTRDDLDGSAWNRLNLIRCVLGQ
jgi:predicted RNA-binding protein YlqC (UPF0109 family)